MAKKNVAVYDGSDTYINRFLKYMNSHKPDWFSFTGFSKKEALKEYLDGTKVDILLFSAEELVEGPTDPEVVLTPFLTHPSVKEFVYLGEHRNSKSRVKHIDKYQAAGEILAELMEILLSGEASPLPAEDGAGQRADLVAVFSPAAEAEAQECAMEIAEHVSIRREVLFVDLERFSLLEDLTHLSFQGGISELIYYYKTNPKNLTACLREKSKRYRNLDVLAGPEDLEDLEEMEEKQWPAFLQSLAESGGYDVVVVYMAEAFRNPDHLFDAASRIYLPTSQNARAVRKMRRFADRCIEKGRRDLYEKTKAILTPSARRQSGEQEETGEEEWNWQKN